MPYADKEQQRIWNREWKQRRQNELALLKENQSCVDCGNRYRFYQLQWDHLPENVKFRNLSKMQT